MKSVAVATIFVLGTFVSCVNSAAVATNGPVEQVVKLLRDLKITLEEDGKKEAKIYNRYACWCDKALKAKAEDIHGAFDLEKQIVQDILVLKSKISVLKSEIEDLEAKMQEEIEEKKEADEAAVKANQEYMAQQAEYTSTLAATEKALVTLRTATKDMHDVGLVQAHTESEIHAKRVSAVKAVLASVPLTTRTSGKSMSLLADFVSSDARYAPQSMTIQGILRDMYETTASDLQKIVSDEAARNTAYETKIEIIESQIALLQGQIDAKMKLKAEAEVDLAQKTSEYDNNKVGIKPDIDFFDTTKKSCLATGTEYEARVALRTEEIKGVEDAYNLLSSDSSRAAFKKAIQGGYGTGVLIQAKRAASFLQLTSNHTEDQADISKAYAAVRALARKTHSIRLASLAVNIRMAKVGHFDQVINSIDTLVATLKTEGTDDIEKRDECVDKYQANTATQEDLKWKIKNNKAIIADLEYKLKVLNADKDKTAADKAANEATLVDLEQAREAANGEYLTAKQDDKQAIQLLEEAKVYISGYYKKYGIDVSTVGNSRMVLAQQSQPVFSKGLTGGVEADFSSGDSRALASKSIMLMLQHLIEDIQAEISHGDKIESEEVLDFQEQKKALDEVIEALTAKGIDLEKAISDKMQLKVDEQAKLDVNSPALDDAVAYKSRITPDCDWIIGAIKERADKRNAEIRGLQEAKEYLAGKLLPPGALLQSQKAEVVGKDPFHKLTSFSS